MRIFIYNVRIFLFPFLFLFFTSISSASQGEELYRIYCSRCHHPERIGYYAPPLLPFFLKNLSDRDIEGIIKEGIPSAPLKPSFPSLNGDEIKAIVSYIRKEPQSIKWMEDDIKKSIEVFNNKKEPLVPENINNLTIVVERGKNSVWVMEGEKIMDRFEFGNIHGGIKFTSDGGRFFIPSRDGWIGRYDLDKGGLLGKVRACVYMRNISLSRDDRYLLASCLLPNSIVLFSSDTLKPLKTILIEGKINALYELQSRDKAVFTFRDMPLIGILDTRTFNVEYLKIDEPLEGFFIDPFEDYVIGSSRGGKTLNVYSLSDGSKVFEYPLESMPHLFSVSWWYNKGSFYFSAPHTKSSYVSIWRMYDWMFIKKIDIGGEGFLVRTNPNTPYLWVDNGTDEIVLIDKKDLSLKKIVPVKGKKVTHTEISSDGRLAYISIYANDGYLVLYDSASLKEITKISARFPAGKYNFVNKSRRFNLSQLGREVFMEKCWGCHHPFREAFGPSFQWIIKNRDEEVVRSYLLNPLEASESVGYGRNVMPKIPLTDREIESVLSFMKESENAQDD